jgi:hypothetical protein
VEKPTARWGIPHSAGLIAVAIALVIALPLSAWIVVNGITDVKQARDTIVVTGSARYPISANLGTWSLRASATGETPSAAIKALRGKVSQIHAFFAQGGLPPESVTSPPIQVARVSLRVPTGLQKPAFKRVQLWRVSQNFQIETTDIDTLDRVASQVGDLLAGGTDVSVSPISYLSTKLVAAKFAALRLAVANAQERATTIAQGLGAHLGALQGTRLGVYQITPRNSNEVSGGGTDDTSSQLKGVEAVVNVTFNIQH